MTAKEFDPVAFCNKWLRERTSFYDIDLILALAAEAAKQQARRDAEICRAQRFAASMAGDWCADAIENEAGL